MGSGSMTTSAVTRQCSYLHPGWFTSTDVAMEDSNEIPGFCSKVICSGTSPFCRSCVCIQIFCLNLEELDFLSALSLEELSNQLWLEKIVLMVRVYWKKPWRAPTPFYLMKYWLCVARGWFATWGLCRFDFFTSCAERVTFPSLRYLQKVPGLTLAEYNSLGKLIK